MSMVAASLVAGRALLEPGDQDLRRRILRFGAADPQLLGGAGDMTPDPTARREARAMLYGFTEYHLDRRMRSFSLLVRQPAPVPTP